MDYNYHTHTFRCGHASGTEEAYIQRAIEGGIIHMGFSDHAPFIFPDGHDSGFRIPVDQVADYFTTISALRNKYKDQITIHIGFEMEYYPEYFDQMLQNARDYGAEYLILGQHFIYNEHPNGFSSNTMNDDPVKLKEYVSNIISAMQSGAFTYIAHPDMFHFIGDKTVYQKEMQQLCAASKKYNIPLEINFLGIRTQRHYPTPLFWEIAAQEQCPVTFGFDAHDALNAYDGESLLTARKMVEDLGLNYIGKPELKKL